MSGIDKKTKTKKQDTQQVGEKGVQVTSEMSVVVLGVKDTTQHVHMTATPQSSPPYKMYITCTNRCTFHLILR